LRNARTFPLLPAALASVPFGFVLVRVRVPINGPTLPLEAEHPNVLIGNANANTRLSLCAYV